jgi:hypothetical protein
MAPEEAVTPAEGPPGQTAGQQTARPRRRSGRGHRGGRGRRRGPRSETEREAQAPVQGSEELRGAQAEHAEATAQQEPEAGFEHEPETATELAEPVARPRQPAGQASVQKAIDQVNEIQQTLRESLDQMEEVLELLEAFERQGDADEREIENLRRALRQLQRPRDGGHHGPRRS